MQKALASESPARYGIFMIIRGLANASGGIGYHLAALRYARHLWRPFREDLERELRRRLPSPEATDLVLIGPSGGYCIEPRFLTEFRSVTAVDVDPLAGVILRRRFPAGIRFIHQDFFSKIEMEGWNLERWLATIGAAPGATVLFSNVLGQLGFLLKESRRIVIEGGLRKALISGGVSWISFHDRFSVKLRTSPRVVLEFEERPSSHLLAEEWTGKWRGHVDFGEVIEHEIGDWINAAHGRFAYLPWRLDSRRTQLIEVCGSR